MTDVCNYADDTTFHACDLDRRSIINNFAIIPENNQGTNKF